MKILQEFHKTCEENNIWYSISGQTLLKIKNNDFDQQKNSNFFEVMMDVESYKKLFEIKNKNIIDTHSRSDYFFTNPFYFIEGSNEVIKINIIVEANVRKTERIYSLKNLLRQRVGYYKSLKIINANFENNDWFKKNLYRFISLFLSPISWQEICLKIYDKKFNGYFHIDSLKPNVNKNWIPSLTKQRKKINWNGVDLFIVDEWESLLIKWFGNDWNANPEIDNKGFNFNLTLEEIKH